MKTKSIKIKRQFLFFTFLIIFTFSTLPVFSQVFHIENSSTLSTNFVQLSCYWEFFPGKFIDPTLTLDENDYNFGLVPFFDNESFENYATKKNDTELFSKTKELSNNPNVYISREINTESFLVDVPSTWNSYRLEEPYITGKGSGSYRLLVTGLDPSKTYGFHVFDLFSNAFSIFVNGEKLITVGSPSEDYTKTVPDLSMDVVYFTPNEKGEANFVLHISNLVHRNGGAWSPIKFAEEEVINSNYRQQLSYAFLCLGILLTIFLYQLFLSLSKKIDLSNLYLAFFALSILIRLIVTPISLIEFFFPNIGYALSLKLEYAALIFGPIFFSLYLSSNLKLLHKIVVKLITIIGLILGIIIFLSSAYFANRFVPIIQTYTIVTCIYFFLIMILSYIRKPNLETGLLLLAVIITIIAVIHDIAAIGNINIFLSSTNLISYAFIIFVFIQTMIIARKQEKSHKSVIRLSESLANANKSYSRFVPKEVLTLL
ncbi:MAG: 7TM-DISM domain-containing protein, partial [Treponemataceae bacterium]|nr:7TM-DISM domain-containing protein [Treponemataceae bacterium]